MKSTLSSRAYAALTPKERFRLILAASGRGDQAERDRLAHAGERIRLAVPDHAPYADAFLELALLTFLELQEEAARYHDACDRLDQVDEPPAEPEGEPDPDTADVKASPSGEANAGGTPSRSARYLDLALAAGYVLRAKADGWQRFCDQMQVPPLLLWQDLPGFDRLQRALTLAERVAFTPEGFLVWLNRLRPADHPVLTAVPLTAATVAADTAAAFRQRARWWGG